MVHSKLNKGFIFDIQGFSVHDGPGCRSLIFFKGCSLKCPWCSNPEGISPDPVLLYNASKCTLDGLCLKACPAGAIKWHGHGHGPGPGPDPALPGQQLFFDRSACKRCETFECISACCSEALNKAGKEITTDALFSKITRDRQYWGSKGGITLTGGEPFVQPDFAREILQRCYDAYIHTAVETSGNIPWDHIEPSLPFLDWIFFDLKHMDTAIHQQFTGSSNQLILSNATRLANDFGGRMVFRMPLIPGFNDHDENISAMATFIRATGRDEINILPVHHFGREKYRLLGQTYFTNDFIPPGIEILQNIRRTFEAAGIYCYAGNDTPF
ncbi:MAG: glycyl-radical enzyme activating protein [Bacteroidota bacterium]